MTGSPWIKGATTAAVPSHLTMTLDQRVAALEAAMLRLQSVLNTYHSPT